MAVTVTLGDEYRWVVLDIILILAVVYWMMIKVAMARKKYGVQVRSAFCFFDFLNNFSRSRVVTETF